jgi:hypothetical protein
VGSPAPLGANRQTANRTNDVPYYWCDPVLYIFSPSSGRTNAAGDGAGKRDKGVRGMIGKEMRAREKRGSARRTPCCHAFRRPRVPPTALQGAFAGVFSQCRALNFFKIIVGTLWLALHK